VQQFTAFREFTSQSRLGVGHVQLADATNSPLPDDSCSVWFTDPPYYDSIPYAHLADCFYVWLKRSLLLKEWDMFSSELILKDGECVVDRPHSRSLSTKDEVFYENKIKEAAAEGRRILTETGCGCIVFAHKTTEGWEALLSGIISSNWMITASWPIATELTSRLNARDTASLATSVHLICRPRHEDAPVGDWGDVLRELPNRVGDWMERLQKEHIRGADLVFACIGPALEIFSRYSKVETADGREVKLAEYLEKVWEVVIWRA
jgi:adenine-specific DNA methylase